MIIRQLESLVNRILISANQFADQIRGIPDPRWPLGKRGEWVAARYLRRKGLEVIFESASDRLGEIDLVAIEKSVVRRVIFVEVKTRTDSTEDHPTERVDEDKQRRLTRAALAFLKKHQLLEHPCRFDVIAVWWPKNGLRPSRIQHYESAFEATNMSSFFS